MNLVNFSSLELGEKITNDFNFNLFNNLYYHLDEFSKITKLSCYSMVTIFVMVRKLEIRDKKLEQKMQSKDLMMLFELD